MAPRRRPARPLWLLGERARTCDETNDSDLPDEVNPGRNAPADASGGSRAPGCGPAAFLRSLERVSLSEGREGSPRHVSPTLDAPSFMYWKSRFDRIEVLFDDEVRVAGLRD